MHTLLLFYLFLPSDLLVPEQYPTIQSAVDAALDGDTILIGPGTYAENVLVDRKSLSLVGRRGPAATVIDGGGAGKVLRIEAVTGHYDVLVEGLTLRNGFSNSGAGLSVVGQNDTLDVEVRRCLIQGNRATFGSAGAAFHLADFVLEDSLIVRNFSAGPGTGGAMSTYMSHSSLIRGCTIADNLMFGAGIGAGIYAWLSDFRVEDTILRGNLAAGVPDPLFSNGNVVLEHCNVDGAAGFPGVGLIDEDSAFVDRAAGDFHLRPDSPCRDAGLASAGSDFELDPRGLGGPGDIGADEHWPHLYHVGPTPAGSIASLRLTGAQVGATCSGWVTASAGATPTSTPFGDWWFTGPRREIFTLAPVPVSGVLDVSFALPGVLPAGMPLYFQALCGAGPLTGLHTLVVQ